MHRRTLTLPEPLTAVARSTPSVPVPEPPLPVEPPTPQPDIVATTALRGVIAALTSLVHELHGQRCRAIGDSAQVSVELAIAVAERLLGANIAANRQRLDEIVRTSLERLPTARMLTVRAHPADIALLEQQLADAVPIGADLSLRPDSTLLRGSMKLEADEWFVTWDTQRALHELREALLEETFVQS